MHLTPREQERLLLAAGADLARRRLARGAPLGATEAVALVCDEVCELAWDGTDLATIIARARALIPPSAVLPGVAAAVPSVQVEALFPHGTTLVHVPAPFGDPPPDGPGAVRPGRHEVPLAPGRQRRIAALHNSGPQTIWVSSHVPLDRLNPALRVELDQPGDYRLDLPAGQALRVDAGQNRQVEVVALEGSHG
ncbi:MAG: urea amidohydrolase [Micromonosporaceae bacterium]|nr:urea amidohydrolase [Micromonosporaceae bacterium]